MRKRGPRESSRLSGSFSSFSGVATADCRYVADVTISLKNCFTSQPDSRNSTASQSSNSGCDGSSPVTPKSPLRADEAGAEHLLPEAVDRDAGRQRILRPQQPLGEAEPVARQVGRHRRQRMRAWPASPGRGACRTRRGTGRRPSAGSGFSCMTWAIVPRALSAASSCCEIAELLRQILVRRVHRRQPPVEQLVLLRRRCAGRPACVASQAARVRPGQSARLPRPTGCGRRSAGPGAPGRRAADVVCRWATFSGTVVRIVLLQLVGLDGRLLRRRR